MTFNEDVFSQLTSFINKNCLENGCNLPDFVIAKHLEAAYFSLCKTLENMAEHYGVPNGWNGAPAWSLNLVDKSGTRATSWDCQGSQMPSKMGVDGWDYNCKSEPVDLLDGEDWESSQGALLNMTEKEETCWRATKSECLPIMHSEFDFSARDILKSFPNYIPEKFVVRNAAGNDMHISLSSSFHDVVNDSLEIDGNTVVVKDASNSGFYVMQKETVKSQPKAGDLVMKYYHPNGEVTESEPINANAPACVWLDKLYDQIGNMDLSGSHPNGLDED